MKNWWGYRKHCTEMCSVSMDRQTKYSSILLGHLTSTVMGWIQEVPSAYEQHADVNRRTLLFVSSTAREREHKPICWTAGLIQKVFHTMENWMMILIVIGHSGGQKYKRIPKRVSQILGGFTHLQLLNTVTQMPVNSLNCSSLAIGLVIPQRDCTVLALILGACL